MRSKVHPTYKTKYRVANLADLQSGLRSTWRCDIIETALTLRLVYDLPRRQAEGFLHALFGIMRLDLSVPDSTTLSRRRQHLRRCLRPVPPGEGLHLVLDSTGLSIVGAGE